MVLINEWLANPTGSDAAGEWVELWNSGNSSVSLESWHLATNTKKPYALHGTIGAGAYLVLPRSATKLSLKNVDGTLALYDPAGHLEDQAAFLGTAQEGQSANRTPTGFFFGKPTPGAPNAPLANTVIAHDNSYPFGVPLDGIPAKAVAGSQFLGGLFGTAVVLAAAILFILKSHENLSHLFFG
jgi:hypothetical protein